MVAATAAATSPVRALVRGREGRGRLTAAAYYPAPVRWSATALCTCTALLLGCGDDDEPARSATVPAGETLVVKGNEYSFDPARIVVTGSGALRIRFDNRGSLAHNLMVLDGERGMAGTQPFSGGERRELRSGLAPAATGWCARWATTRSRG